MYAAQKNGIPGLAILVLGSWPQRSRLGSALRLAVAGGFDVDEQLVATVQRKWKQLLRNNHWKPLFDSLANYLDEAADASNFALVLQTYSLGRKPSKIFKKIWFFDTTK